jgi:serine-type D-Ala-D-Ala carboxypeptidase
VNGLFDDWVNDGKAVWRSATLPSRGKTGYRAANQAKNSDQPKPTRMGTQIQVPLGCANTLTLHGVSSVAQGGHNRGVPSVPQVKAEAAIRTLSVLPSKSFPGSVSSDILSIVTGDLFIPNAFTASLELCYNPIIESKINREPEGSSFLTKRVQPAASAPIPEYDDQNSVFESAFPALKDGGCAHAFPACSVAVTYRGKLVALKAFGRFTYDADSAAVTTASIFDLASVSKVVATTPMAMMLYERGLLDLEIPVVGVVPEFASDDPRRHEITFRMLLAHSSGLPAYEKLFLRARTREDLLRAAFKTPLITDPGAGAEYSDIGFLILGVALERLADESLDRFCQREIFGPLGMAQTMFNPPNFLRSSIVPTADDRTLRNRVIQGEVQDENASVLGGVAGHAGVFTTAQDLAIFAEVLLHGGLLRPETISLFTRRESLPTGTSRALGWDTPSSPSQSGKYFSARSFGHLGYTGTSLWIDPERQLSVTLLTNRTWPDCSNQAIKQLRPKFHDAVVEALEKSR